MNTSQAKRELRAVLLKQQRSALTPMADPDREWHWASKVIALVLKHYQEKGDQEGIEQTDMIAWALYRREQWALDNTKHWAAREVWKRRKDDPQWANSETGQRFKEKAEAAERYHQELLAEAKRRGLQVA